MCKISGVICDPWNGQTIDGLCEYTLKNYRNVLDWEYYGSKWCGLGEWHIALIYWCNKMYQIQSTKVGCIYIS